MSRSHLSGEPDYEKTDAAPRLAGILAASLAAMILAGFIAGTAIVHSRQRIEPSAVSNSGFQNGPDHRLGVSLDWQQEEQEVRFHLSGYRWVDKSKGIVQIPIDRAMELIATKHPTLGKAEEFQRSQ